MSTCFTSRSGKKLWWPANLGARVFHDQAEAVGRMIEVETGLGPIVHDEVVVDDAKLEAFVNAFTVFMLRVADNSTARALLENCFAIAVAMAKKAGAKLPELGRLADLLARGERWVG